MTKTVLPGSTIGIFGGGQLGRMSAVAAKRMGYRVMVFDPEQESPAAQIADASFCGDYLDEEEIHRFARQVDIITFEFENIPVQTLLCAAHHAEIHPCWAVLETVQNRHTEKAFVQRLGIDTVPYRRVKSWDAFIQAIQTLQFPVVAKTVCGGYDGKGQIQIHTSTDIRAIWDELGQSELVVESWIDLELEFSVILARNPGGRHALYGPIYNEHQHHILDCSLCPFRMEPSIEDQAKESIQAIAEAMNYVGVLCVEFFLSREGKLYFNEMAPRPHNSGHLTLESHYTSQFEQHIRSICGLPLGNAEQRRPAAMVNLLGDLWKQNVPNWMAVLQEPNAYLHLYGKRHATAGRKMGHITVLADSAQAARKTAIRVREKL